MEHWQNISLIDIEEYVDGIGLVKEEWRDIPNYEGLYQVSSFGRVKSLQRTVEHLRCGKKTVGERIRKLYKQANGYIRLDLSKNHIKEIWTLHVLVGSVFIENPEGKPTVNHKWGIKSDNKVSGLEWATWKEQDDHARRTGLKISLKGEQIANSKLSNSDVLSIFNSSDSIQILAKRFNVKDHAIWDIKRGNSWRHLTGKEPDKKRILTKADILGIYNSPLSQRKTAREFGVESTTVFNIKHGKRYADITGKR